ncbi:MAG: hypothetical protein HC869_24750, partial [Rhodospirillales bacterium]|nr:hypothetical protein [Rhodospirillales bacterium]
MGYAGFSLGGSYGRGEYRNFGAGSNNGVSASLPGTGSALTTLAANEALCLALSNTGLGNWTVRVDTQS